MRNYLFRKKQFPSMLICLVRAQEPHSFYAIVHQIHDSRTSQVRAIINEILVRSERRDAYLPV